MRQTGTIFLLVLFSCMHLYPIPPIDIKENISTIGTGLIIKVDMLKKGDMLYAQGNFSEAIASYNQALEDHAAPESILFKKLALSYSALGNPEEAVRLLEQSLFTDLSTNILSDSGFDAIRNSPDFIALEEKYLPNFTIWSFMYLYVALIGFYIAFILHFKKKIDGIAKRLISGFIFIHSFFIFHICLNITNYQYEFPHTYLMSTAFSFLYGPLFYFYFKRITQQYRFRKIDFLHLLPTVLLLLYLLPIYGMSGEDKLGLMLRRVSEGLNAGDSAYIALIVALKFTSLLVYGILAGKLYLKGQSNKELSRPNKIWQRNVLAIHAIYIVTYGIYGILIVSHISSGLFYHLPIISMSLMVMYLGFSASVQPSVFSGLYAFENQLFFKYEKSGLTSSLSKELKDNLERLFEIEKIYKENDISLDTVADKLNTTRHNASQVINEHFGVNFHEMINKYRIQEAKYLLKNDQHKNLNIIDIAYEVGFNNKVTFNKAFKKDTNLTPSEYQRNISKLEVKYT
ncbi:helix-turn-helix domain-containing protein [Flavobacteriaceae bacterium TP-CH-4]|uniref:Helix-turn-helix domain-containing protein n=1 Tax=Pelagihabitans pacificus TaxID=2696054 RepID=A0A967AR07_9FLAO|nr:AraC family transcriptional regulator [Pelagihabitans pacificus]NHF57920.1 helix-turn-helix domain-containing protein [Pelagihabitans pacificus]